MKHRPEAMAKDQERAHLNVLRVQERYGTTPLTGEERRAIHPILTRPGASAFLEWWSARPWRPPQHWEPIGTTSEERAEIASRRAHAYYVTHRSARVARWGILSGLLTIAAGFLVSMSLNGVEAHLGDGIMVLGIAVAIVAAMATATARS